MPQCPFCKTETSSSTKEWNYCNNYYRVKSFKCPHCGLGFRGYYHENNLSHTIPKSPSNQEKIRKFLRVNFEAKDIEIANRLNLDLEEVLALLREMEKDGVIYSVSK